VNHRGLRVVLALGDALLAPLHRRAAPSLPRAPRRILLAIGGQLGDAVIATATIRRLRAAFPESELGVVLPSWARAVIAGHADVRWIHTVDHWKVNRSALPWWKRWRSYRSSQRTALHAIRGVEYDVALDLYGYYPNMAVVLWRSAIPIRIGFMSGGLGRLYTHGVEWGDDLRHVAERQAALVDLLAEEARADASPTCDLPVPTTAARVRGTERLAREGVREREYVVVHMGSGAAERRWPASEWKLLLAQLAAEGHTLVFTGRGAEEMHAIREQRSALPDSVDLGDQLDWEEFVHIVRQARLVITVETAAAHVAGAVGTPCVAVWSGTTSTAHWRPLGTSAELVTNAVPCAPCFRGRGCEHMTCLRGLAASQVLAAVHRALDGRPPVATSDVDDETGYVAR
jgi:ADP-heptose:LPS heptosyltransferase